MSALVLRIIACIAMLLDHIGFYSGDMTLRAIGRIAFPIFVYLICNGYRHTSCKWKYALRLAVFALISQIPFSLFCTNTVNDSNGNVFVTLLVSLLCIWSTDALRSNRLGRWLCWMPTIVTCLLYQTGMLTSDYGARGIVLAMVFFLLDGPKVWNKLLVIAGSFVSVFYTQLISCSWMLMQHGMLICPNINRWDLWQLFSLCALPLIFLYSGKKGNVPGAPWLAKALQYGFYIFYPAHLLVIWLLNRI